MTHHEPWDTMHDAAHAYAVERLTEAVEGVRQATGWVGILPETGDHLTAMLEAISDQLASVLRQVDRPTLLADFDNKVERAEEPEEPELSASALEPDENAAPASGPKVYRFDESGDLDDA